MPNAPSTSRRKFLTYAAAIGAAMAIPKGILAIGRAAEASGSLRSSRSNVDVVVIGAGLAGLTTAYRLLQQGATVQVLEANNRVGGRTLNTPTTACAPAESGGQWIGPGQDAIFSLMAELGITHYPSYTEGETVGFDDLSAGQQANLDDFVAQLSAMANQLDPAAPWDHAQAATWDAITVEDWLNDNVGFILNMNVYLTMWFEVSTWLDEPTNVSLLYFLFYLRSAGGWEALAVDAQETRITGGSHSISVALKLQIEALGGSVGLGLPVLSLETVENGVEIQTEGDTWNASQVVVAMSPRDASNISFSPALPADRSALQEGWDCSASWKMSAFYPTPFWRDSGLSGIGGNDSIYVCFDNTPEDESCGIIVAFPGESVSGLPTAEERRDAFVAGLVELFGDQAADPIDVAEKDWSDENWIRGCTPSVGPGLLSQFGHALREPVGRIHWAGTETSAIWAGYMDGAVRSGERAAEDVSAVLSVTSIAQPEAMVVYPNPASLQANLPLAAGPCSFWVMNSLGRKVYQGQYAGHGTLSIDMEGWPAGVYFINTSRGQKAQFVRSD
jgi:monoamine oxidase